MRKPNRSRCRTADICQCRQLTDAAVLTSGCLSLIRGLADFAGARGALVMPVRCLRYSVGTVLLTAALMLMAIMQQFPFVHARITVKVPRLVVYIVVGWHAFWTGRSRGVRIGAGVEALAVYGFIVSAARIQDPLGILTEIMPASIAPCRTWTDSVHERTHWRLAKAVREFFQKRASCCRPRGNGQPKSQACYKMDYQYMF